uniref:Uncharacterized protein n=1 Tax=Rhizophora mucronata TaxID=61149 RepID=A0A2P2NEF5_RHIMU
MSFPWSSHTDIIENPTLLTVCLKQI